MELAIMIEGQNGLDWPQWKRIAAEVEGLGFAGLYRSDHFTNPHPPDKDSLELWVSLTWLAEHTTRLRFGPVVSPVTFRHPALSARVAMQVDALSGGRLTLGLGAGWQEREHQMFGLPLMDMKSRFDRFEEGLEVASRLIRSEEPVTLAGHYYQLHEAQLLPRPRWSQRPDGGATTTPILVGGNGERRTLPLAARHADEWNAVMIPPARFRELNAQLDVLLDQQGRHRRSVRRSLMHALTYGSDRAALEHALAWRSANSCSRADDRQRQERREIVGVAEEVVPQIEAYEEAGVECLMLQWLPLDDVEGLRHFASIASRWLRPPT